MSPERLSPFEPANQGNPPEIPTSQTEYRQATLIMGNTEDFGSQATGAAENLPAAPNRGPAGFSYQARTVEDQEQPEVSAASNVTDIRTGKAFKSEESAGGSEHQQGIEAVLASNRETQSMLTELLAENKRLAAEIEDLRQSQQRLEQTTNHRFDQLLETIAELLKILSGQQAVGQAEPEQSNASGHSEAKTQNQTKDSLNPDHPSALGADSPEPNGPEPKQEDHDDDSQQDHESGTSEDDEATAASPESEPIVAAGQEGSPTGTAEAAVTADNEGDLSAEERRQRNAELTEENQAIHAEISRIQSQWNRTPYNQRPGTNLTMQLERNNNDVADLVKAWRKHFLRTSSRSMDMKHISERQNYDFMRRQNEYIRQQLTELERQINPDDRLLRSDLETFGKLYAVVPDKHKRGTGELSHFDEQLQHFGGNLTQLADHWIQYDVSRGKSRSEAIEHTRQRLEKLLTVSRRLHNKAGGGFYR